MAHSDSETASENEPDYQQPPKRRKLETSNNIDSKSLERQRSISPPILRRTYDVQKPDKDLTTVPSPNNSCRKPVLLPSPFQLTHIRDLPDHLNIDTIKLKNILGDPLIKECWQFNFLIDLDFLM